MIDFKDKASECLKCTNARCMTACPLSVRIPQINKLIEEGNFEEAFDIAFEDNPLGAVCGIVCPHERQCEGACIKGFKSTPIDIGNIEEQLWEWKLSNLKDIKMKSEPNNLSNKKVAIVGGGPSGIACASYLLRNNVNVTIFEKENYLGGILIYGIPDFRLDSELVKKNIEFTLNYKVTGNLEIKYNHLLVSKGIKYPDYSLITLEELEKEFDYIFIAIGLECPKSLGLTNDTNKDFVIDAHSFLKNKHELDNKRVVVIGGGNVAIDSARKAKKEGAYTTIIYRRRKEDMPANKKEIEEAEKEGVEFIFTTKVLDIAKDKELLLSLDNGSTFKTDYLIEAIGSKINSNYFEEELELTEENYVKEKSAMKLINKNIFLGGDLVNDNQIVANAVHTGLDVAKIIIN